MPVDRKWIDFVCLLLHMHEKLEVLSNLYLLGTLGLLDLSGNTWDYKPVYASMLADIQCNGRLLLILPSLTPDAPYDADP